MSKKVVNIIGIVATAIVGFVTFLVNRILAKKDYEIGYEKGKNKALEEYNQELIEHIEDNIKVLSKASKIIEEQNKIIAGTLVKDFVIDEKTGEHLTLEEAMSGENKSRTMVFRSDGVYLK